MRGSPREGVWCRQGNSKRHLDVQGAAASAVGVGAQDLPEAWRRLHRERPGRLEGKQQEPSRRVHSASKD